MLHKVRINRNQVRIIKEKVIKKSLNKLHRITVVTFVILENYVFLTLPPFAYDKHSFLFVSFQLFFFFVFSFGFAIFAHSTLFVDLLPHVFRSSVCVLRHFILLNSCSCFDFNRCFVGGCFVSFDFFRLCFPSHSLVTFRLCTHSVFLSFSFLLPQIRFPFVWLLLNSKYTLGEIRGDLEIEDREQSKVRGLSVHIHTYPYGTRILHSDLSSSSLKSFVV